MQEQIIVVVHVVDGVIATVASNNRNIAVLICDEDDNMEIPATVSKYDGDGLFIFDKPEKVFIPEGPDTPKDKRLKASFQHQIRQAMEDESYYKDLAEKLKGTDGFVRVYTQDCSYFIEKFQQVNPFMKIKLEPADGEDDWGEEIYNVIVKSGG